MTELKAVAHLDDTNLSQAINYVEAYNLPVGLLLNFGSKKLEFKKTYNTKHPDNAGLAKCRDKMKMSELRFIRLKDDTILILQSYNPANLSSDK